MSLLKIWANEYTPIVPCSDSLLECIILSHTVLATDVVFGSYDMYYCVPLRHESILVVSYHPAMQQPGKVLLQCRVSWRHM